MSQTLPRQPRSSLLIRILAGKASAFNDLYELDTQDAEEYKWKELAASNPPPHRARHAAIAVSMTMQLFLYMAADGWQQAFSLG